MKSASVALAAHIAGEGTTLATLWRIVRRDGVVFRFTDHDQPIVYSGETYSSSLGYTRAAVSSNADLAVAETEIAGFVAPGTADFTEIRAGIWDGARARLWIVNWADLTQGEIKLRKATLGEFIIDDAGRWRVEVRGLAQPLQATVGSVYTPTCRADLGDARCRINLAFGGGWTQEAAIDAVTDSVTLVMSGALSGFADGWFDGGVAIWQTGPNAGVAREVVGWNQSSLTLSLFAPPPYAPSPAETLHVQPGCDRRWATCKGRFSNQLNFRGEPLLTGAASMLGIGAS